MVLVIGGSYGYSNMKNTLVFKKIAWNIGVQYLIGLMEKGIWVNHQILQLCMFAIKPSIYVTTLYRSSELWYIL